MGKLENMKNLTPYHSQDQKGADCVPFFQTERRMRVEDEYGRLKRHKV